MAESKITVTCFKRKNDKSGNSFINSYGSSRSEWDLLKDDASLRSLNCDFQVVEYDDIRALGHGYDKKIDKPLYIDVRFMENYESSIAYRSVLLATHIAAFVIEFAKRQTIVIPQVDNAIVVIQPSENQIVEKETQVETPQQPSFVNSWKLPVTIVGGIMFLLLIAGTVAFFDWRRRKGSTLQRLTPFFLSEVPVHSPHVNFAAVKSKVTEGSSLLEEAEL